MRGLAQDGWRVRILSRRDPVDPAWQDFELEVVPGDLDDVPALQRLCAGAELVVHSAGLVKARSRAAFDRVNVDGARRLAMAAAGVPHVMLISSLTAREPRLSHYGASKHAGETVMAEVLGERLTIARPCAIYGPGDRELLPVFRAADVLPILPVLNPAARVAMIHVDDAARQIATLAASAPAGRPVALCDAQTAGYSWVELMGEAARACGRAPRFAPIPDVLVHAIGITNDFAMLLGGSPMLSSAKARELTHLDWSVHPGECPAGVDAALYSLAAGFAQTVAWYRSAAWMKH